MGKGSTTSTTTIPPPTAQELALMDLSLQVLPVYLRQSGIDVQVQETTLDDDPKYSAAKSKMSNAQLRIDQINQKYGSNTNNPTYLAEMQKAQNELNNAQREMSNISSKFTPTYKFDASIPDLPDINAVRKQYGEDSPQFAAAKKDYDEFYGAGAGEKYAQQGYLDQQIFDQTLKLMSGDFAQTPEQRQFIKATYKPQYDALDAMYKDILSVAENSKENFDKVFNTEFNNLMSQIDKTGLEFNQALDVVGSQIEKTGTSMKDALNNTIKTREELLKMDIDDYTGEITKNVAMNAAAIGRAPDDPEYMMEIQSSIADQVRRGQLQLADYQAQAEMGIAERTGSGLEGVAMERANAAMGLGQQRVGATEMALQNRVGAQSELDRVRMAAAEGRGQGRMALAGQEANLGLDLAVNLPSQFVGLGMGVGQYDQAMQQQNLANMGAGVAMPADLAGTYQRERMAQPTTTQTRSTGVGDVLGGLVGTAAGVVGAYTGINTGSYYRKKAAGLTPPPINPAG